MNGLALRRSALLVMLVISAACGGDPEHVNCSVNKCLPTSQSQFATYCQSVASKAQVCDCPGGSPGAGCVLSPTGAANVYCCP